MGGRVRERRGRSAVQAAAWLTLSVLLALGCSSRAPLVPSGPHPPGDPAHYERVGFAPPPARVEVLPLQRRDACRWRDGHWAWQGQAWSWVAGAWILPPPDCHYAPPELTWVRSGGGSQLVYRAPRWYPNAGNQLDRCEEARACTSLLPEVDRLDEGPPPTDRPQRLPTAK